MKQLYVDFLLRFHRIQEPASTGGSQTSRGSCNGDHCRGRNSELLCKEKETLLVGRCEKMKAVVAVDSFKGSMTSMQAGNAVKARNSFRMSKCGGRGLPGLLMAVREQRMH